MECAIVRLFDIRTHLVVPNISWGLLSHEADVLVVRKTGYCLEFEIKRSFSDFKKDFTKRKFKEGSTGNHMWKKNIKEFTYVFPAKLFKKRRDEIMAMVPGYAGVLICYENTSGGAVPWTEWIQNPKPSSEAKPLTQKQMYDVARLGMIRIWPLKRALIKYLKR